LDRPDGIRPRDVVRAAIAHTPGTALTRYADRVVRCTACGIERRGRRPALQRVAHEAAGRDDAPEAKLQPGDHRERHPEDE
jgi:hypothetical protein